MKSHNINKLPSVTVAIPAFNEEDFIEGVIQKFQNSQYPNILEIMIADGRSTDKTAEIVRKIAQKDPRVKLVDNPERIQSAGLNQMIKIAKGDLLLRADAHCEYSDNYVEATIEAYNESSALNVGGAQRFIAKTPFQSFIALAVLNILGSGGAKYRDVDFTGFADTVFIGCYQTDVVRKLGGFRTDNGPNEDTELNARLQKVQKNAIYISSDVKVWYYPRGDFKALFKQYFRYGKARCLTTFRHFLSNSLRGSVPFIAVSSLIIIASFLVWFGYFETAALLFGSTILGTIAYTSISVVRQMENFNKIIWRGLPNEKPSFVTLLLGTYMVILTINTAHFLGFGWQLIRYLFGKKNW